MIQLMNKEPATDLNEGVQDVEFEVERLRLILLKVVGDDIMLP